LGNIADRRVSSQTDYKAQLLAAGRRHRAGSELRSTAWSA